MPSRRVREDGGLNVENYLRCMYEVLVSAGSVREAIGNRTLRILGDGPAYVE